jgi:ABC-type polysaccharide/polyol phosphate transport system ATPase subunit
MSALIEARRVSKTFTIPSARHDTVREQFFGLFERRRIERLRVLDDVTLQLRRGEALGIMGRNGSGKSTLLKVLCGIYNADAGDVQVSAGITPILELGIGWNPELDAIDNVYLIGSVMGLSLSAIRESLGEILAFAELERFAKLPLKHYSSGMATRLAYAVAFRAIREVLVLDEILAVGDAGFKAKCIDRYHALRAAGHTVMLVSHDPRLIAAFCTRAILMEAGRIIGEGSAADIAEQYVDLTSGSRRPAIHP